MAYFKNEALAALEIGVTAIPGAIIATPGVLGSYAQAINPFDSLNAFRLTEGYRYGEGSLAKLSPKPKEAMSMLITACWVYPNPMLLKIMLQNT